MTPPPAAAFTHTYLVVKEAEGSAGEFHKCLLGLDAGVEVFECDLVLVGRPKMWLHNLKDLGELTRDTNGRASEWIVCVLPALQGPPLVCAEDPLDEGSLLLK